MPDTSVRDQRADAIRRRHRDLADDFSRGLPLLLDDLDAIDQEHAERAADGEMTEADAALLAREMGRTREAAAELVQQPAKPATAARTAPRRRTTR